MRFSRLVHRKQHGCISYRPSCPARVCFVSSSVVSLAEVIFGPTKCSHQQRRIINFSDWPALDIDFSNMISPQRGGRKQRRASSCFRHMLLTLTVEEGAHFCTHPTTGLISCTGRSQRPRKWRSSTKRARFYLGYLWQMDI